MRDKNSPLSPSVAGDQPLNPESVFVDKCPTTVLLLEDNPDVRRVGAILLKKEGFCVLQAQDEVSARKVWGESLHQIDLLLSDIMLPNGLNGFEIAKFFRRAKPKLKVLLMSGFMTETLTSILEEDMFFLTKPFDLKDLRQKLNECLNSEPVHEPIREVLVEQLA